jgi:methyl-accepting chemotaxis protein
MQARTKIIASVCLLFSIVIFVITLLSYSNFSSASNADKRGELDVIANGVAEAVSAKMTGYFGTLEFAATQFQNPSPLSGDDLYNYRQTLINDVMKNTNALQSYYGFKDGSTYTDKGRIPDFEKIALEREWYKRLHGGEKRVVTTPYVSNAGLLIMAVGVPLMTEDTVTGTLCINIALTELSDFASGLFDFDNVILTRSDGFIMAHHDPDMIGKSLWEAIPALEAENSQTQDARVQFTMNEEDYGGSVSVINDLGWKVWVFEKQSVIQAASTANLYSSSIQALVALILSGIMIGLLITYLIFKPMAGMTSVMQRLAEGDTEAEVPGQGREDEIGKMAAAVQVFKDNAIRKREMEVEAEVNRSATEAERLEVEQVKAKQSADIKFAVDQLAEGLERLAAGDVSKRLELPFVGELEALRGNFNESIAKLSEALGAVGENASAIDCGAKEIRAAADDLSKRTEQQAAFIEETSAALTEITATVSNATQRAEEAGQLVARTKTSADKAGEVVIRAVSAMEVIEKSANEISNIISVMDEIAFQTNLLALNAGVEAARAGEAGKGFAVVAQEVRELAQRSATAAKEISGLICASTAQVENGVQLVGETGRALEEIGKDVHEISTHMNAIVESSREQSTGIREINSAVTQMDQSTQQNASMVEETTAATYGLAQEVESLNRLLSKFELAKTAPTVGKTASGNKYNKVVGLADGGSVSKPSPARVLGKKLVAAFSGDAEHKAVASGGGWDEF